MKTKISSLIFLLFIYLNTFSQITITFTVDIQGLYIGPGGVHIAGEFATDSSTTILTQWDPSSPNSQLSLITTNTYTIAVDFPSSVAGDSLQFEFVRDNVWSNTYGDMSEGNGGDPSVFLNDSCAIDDQVGGLNRLIFIPDCGGTYSCIWNHCGYIVADPCDTLGIACTNPNICEKFCTGFTDQSTNNPTAWHWIFPGGTPSTSTEQNPTNICYDVPGSYDVTLITFNASGSDTLTFPNYITVNATPPSPTITQTGYTLTSSSAVSYQWQLNLADITGATNQSYDVMQTGYYTVITSDSNGCENSSTVYVVIEGIQSLETESFFTIFPNPATNVLNIKFPARQSAVVKITEITGRTVFSENINTSAEIDISQLCEGMYFLVCSSGNHSATKSFSIVKK